MPAWSPEIANEFIRLGHEEGETFGPKQLQSLVYIAHGWCLALMGQPLTRDRPDWFEDGAEYRRLADALAGWGVEPVDRQLVIASFLGTGGEWELSRVEHAIIAKVYSRFGGLEPSKLAALNRGSGTIWEHVFVWFGEGPRHSSRTDQRLI